MTYTILSLNGIEISLSVRRVRGYYYPLLSIEEDTGGAMRTIVRVDLIDGEERSTVKAAVDFALDHSFEGSVAVRRSRALIIDDAAEAVIAGLAEKGGE